MALGDYTKTTYVNGSAPGLSANNLNNNENKTEELDTELAAHLADTAKHCGANYVQNTEPSDKTQGKTWFNPDTGVLYVADGARYIPIPPVQVLQEVIDFTESEINVSLTNLEIKGGSLCLTSGYDVSKASYTGKSFDVSGQETNPCGIVFSNDGTKMFIVGSITDTVYQYTLSTAWDISTASYDNKSLDVSGQETNPTGIAFNDDGTKMFIVGYDTDSVYQYTLSAAWDVSTASYDSVSFDVSGQETSPQGIAFSSDGTKMFIVGYDTDSVYQYTLSTAWDISSASYASKSFSVTEQSAVPQGIAFSSDGTRMFVIESGDDTVYQYTLSTAWDISTANYTGKSFSASEQETYATEITFNNDGTKMFVIGSSSDTVYQYTLSMTWDTLPTTPGTAIIEWNSHPSDIKAWDLATYQVTLDGETVTIDVEQSTDGGATWTTAFSDIDQNFDISTIDPTYYVRFKVNLSRANAANNPTCDYLARRFVR